MRHALWLAGALVVGGVVGGNALGAEALYYDRDSFLTDARIGATSEIRFDDPGMMDADVNFTTILGARLTAMDSLMVIDASTGVRFPMSTSTGTQLISPGGVNTASQNDDLMITFATPRQAFGLDVVFDAPDGLSQMSVTFYDTAGHVIAENDLIPSPVGAPGFQFVGLVSDGPAIGAIFFNDYDDTPSDENIAYDSMIFSVPAPGSVGLLGLASVVASRRGRENVRRA